MATRERTTVTALTSGSAVLACLLLALGCDGDKEEGWQVVHEGLEGGLLGVWASDRDDVWAVGADTGSGPTVLRFDGEAWSLEDTGESGDLWWVHGFAGGPVYLGGDGGMILRYDGAGFERMTTPGTGIIFGVWGASPDDMWAVGGNQGGASGAFAWRLEGDEWVEAPGFPEELADADALWKVFGRSADDVVLVGTSGTVLRWNGTALAVEDSGASVSLFTVCGDAERYVAVGGSGTGALIENDGDGWIEATPAGSSLLNGCSFGADGEGYATAADGTVFRRDGGEWTLEPRLVFDPLHAVMVDTSGDVWAVGGRVLSAPLEDGVLLHKGPAVPEGF